MKKKYALLLLAALCLALFCACGAAVNESVPVTEEKQETAEIVTAEAPEPEQEEPGAEPQPAAEPEEPAEEPEEPAEEPEPEELPVLEKFEPWLARNPYVVGWLNMLDGGIDAPVLFTPGDQNFFLRRDIDGNSAVRGTLFIGTPWREGNNQTLIYGHNMPDGTMFGGLLKYADAAYGASHPVLHFDTLHEEGEYRLLGAFYSEIFETEDIETTADREAADAALGAWDTVFDLNLWSDYPDYDELREIKDLRDGKFRYYYFTDLSDPADFAYFVEQVKASALYDTGVEPEWGDKMLTLSTCSGGKASGRFVVVACRKAD